MNNIATDNIQVVSSNITEYLFVSITQLNIKGTIEPIQVSAIGLDKNLCQTQTFSKGVRPSDISTLSDDRLKQMGSCLQNLRVSKDKDTVFTNLMSLYKTYNYIVVWDMNTYELFKSILEWVGIELQQHTVLCVKDILRFTCKLDCMYMDFEGALTYNGVEFNLNDLNYSRKRVEYLKELYVSTYLDYQKLTVKETNASYNKESRVVHIEGCRYIKPENVVGSCKHLLFNGYRPCKVCYDAQEYKRLDLPYEGISKEDITEGVCELSRGKPLDKAWYNPLVAKLICDKFEVILKEADDNFMLVETSVGSWKIFIDNNRVIKILHRRLIFNRSSDDYEYHRQKVQVKTPYEAVKYISGHDKGLLIPSLKKSRIERLFDQIESERRYKKHG